MSVGHWRQVSAPNPRVVNLRRQVAVSKPDITLAPQA